jgi:hypothetical protein
VTKHWTDLLVELLVGIAWPAVAVLAVLLFRSQIKILIGRMRSAGRTGVQFDPPQPPTSPSNPKSPLPLSAGERASSAEAEDRTLTPKDLLPNIYHDFFDYMVERARFQLETAVRRLAGTREELLIAMVAELGGIVFLERASRHIFRSQIEALDNLKFQQGPLTKAAFRPFYDRAAQAFPQVYANYGFEQWLAFLVGVELLSVAQDDTVTITKAGRVVSRYMADRGYAPVLA